VFIGSEGNIEALSYHLVGIRSSIGQHEFGLDLMEVVDYFKQGDNDITGFERIVVVNKIVIYFFKTLMSSVVKGKPIGSLTL